jgi:hypothetical protein
MGTGVAAAVMDFILEAEPVGIERGSTRMGRIHADQMQSDLHDLFQICAKPSDPRSSAFHLRELTAAKGTERGPPRQCRQKPRRIAAAAAPNPHKSGDCRGRLPTG